MGAWVWFVIAVVAGVGGVALLLVDRNQRTSHSRERRRWAALRGWDFAAEDPALPDRWRHGTMAREGASTARDLVSGSLFTAAGRRQVYVFDHERAGASSVVVAVHRQAPQPIVLELWLPTVEFPADARLELLGPVGDRYAFTTELAKARPLITPELAGRADDAGDDVPVMWIEDAWVVASVGSAATPSRLERLLRLLGDLADLVDGAHAADQPVDLPRDRHDDEPADQQPADWQPADEEPADGTSMDEALVDEELLEEEPVDERRTGEGPTDEQRRDEQRTDEGRTGEQRTDEEPAGEEPADERRTGEGPTDEKRPDEKNTDENRRGEKDTDVRRPGGPATGERTPGEKVPGE